MAECWLRGVTLEPGSVQELLVASLIEHQRRERILSNLLTAASGVGDVDRTQKAYDMLLRHLSPDVEVVQRVKEKIGQRRLAESLTKSFSLSRGSDGRIVLTEAE